MKKLSCVKVQAVWHSGGDEKKVYPVHKKVKYKIIFCLCFPFAETIISVHKTIQLICYIVHAEVCSQSLYYPVPNILHSMNTSLFQTLLILSCL